MSLAHIKVAKVAKLARKPPSAAGAQVPPAPRTGAVAECGASHEPLYRTVEEANDSGLEVCDMCLAIMRKQGRPTR
jgi:hypothetical protein